MSKILSSIFIIFLSFSNILQCSCAVMIVFYGSFDSSSDCEVQSSITTWDDCLTACKSTKACYQTFTDSLTSTTCRFCGFGALTNLQYLNQVSDTIVAIKSDTTTCPSELSTELLPSLKVCNGTAPSKFVREKYTVCVMRDKYLSYFTKSAASDACANLNAIIIGMENSAETTKMTWRNPSYTADTGSWLALVRVNGTFVWQDPWLTGDGDINWAAGHPMTGYNCGVLQVNTSLIQSQRCEVTTCSGSFCPQFVVCGWLMQ